LYETNGTIGPAGANIQKQNPEFLLTFKGLKFRFFRIFNPKANSREFLIPMKKKSKLELLTLKIRGIKNPHPIGLGL
jgi:hypothetical protein